MRYIAFLIFNKHILVEDKYLNKKTDAANLIVKESIRKTPKSNQAVNKENQDTN